MSQATCLATADWWKGKKINSINKVEQWYILLPEAPILHHCKLDNTTKNVVGKVYPVLAQRDGLDSLLKFLAVSSIMNLITWMEKIDFYCGWEQLDCILCSTLCRLCSTGATCKNDCFLWVRRRPSNDLIVCYALASKLVCHRPCSMGSFRVKSRRIVSHSVFFCPSNFLALAVLTFFSSSSAHCQGVHLRKLHPPAAPTWAGLAAGDISLFGWLAVRHFVSLKDFPPTSFFAFLFFFWWSGDYSKHQSPGSDCYKMNRWLQAKARQDDRWKREKKQTGACAQCLIRELAFH